MITKTTSHTAKTRCYKCGSPEIFAICTHCGRSMCEKHCHHDLPVRLGFWKALMIKWGFKDLSDEEFSQYDEGFKRLSFREEVMAAFGLAKICNSEYEGFVVEQKLESDAGDFQQLGFKWRQLKRRLVYYWGAKVQGMEIGKAIHCEFCTHNVSRYPALMWLGLILILSLFGSPIGILSIIWGVSLNKKYYMQAQIDQMPPLPIFFSGLENKEGIKIRDEMNGSIALSSDGKYQHISNQPEGSIEANIIIGQDAYETNRAYLQKLDDLQVEKSQPDSCDIGSLKFGEANWVFDHPEIFSPNSKNIAKISSKDHGEKIKTLISSLDKQSTVLNLNYRYAIQLDDNEDDNNDGSGLPVQVVISISPDSDQKALDLELELLDFGGEKSKSKNSKTLVEEFCLFYPTSWGSLVNQRPEGIVRTCDDEKKGFISISWKKIVFDKDPDRVHKSFYLQFSNKIQDNMKLEGKMILKIPRNLSGNRYIRLFSPLGKNALADQKLDIHEKTANRNVKRNSETTVNIDMDLDLSGLRYQNLKLLEKKILQEGVVPDGRLITFLVNNLSESEFYVKKVIENPSRTSKEGAHKINRFWDISGRKYDGVYPVEFHMVLTGEEIAQQAGGLKAGQLSVEMSVQGSSANQEMSDQVENVGESLVESVRETLELLPESNVRFSHSAAHPQMRINQDQQIEEIVIEEIPVEEEIQVTEEKIITKPADDRAQKIQKIKQRLDLIEERVILGEISETLYYELKEKYENEIKSL